MAKSTDDILQRLTDRTIFDETVTGCWLWQGFRDPRGYGRISLGGRPALTHRAAWEAKFGPIPDGVEPDHLCRVTSCWNWDHLELVTRQENILRGDNPRLQRERHAARTHCKQGHELTPENTRRRPRDQYERRECRECARLQQTARRAKRVAL